MLELRAAVYGLCLCLCLCLWKCRAAAEPPRVAREIEYALAREQGQGDRPPRIASVPVEGPPIPAPPDNRRHLHSNDALLADVAAAQSSRKRHPSVGVVPGVPLWTSSQANACLGRETALHQDAPANDHLPECRAP
jgi:hypothetical protein